MSDNTTHLTLPYVVNKQAQRHIFHDEAMRILDALVMLSVIDRDLSAPPGSPAEGDRYLVKATGTGAFAGKDNRIAHFSDGAWFFYAPSNGWLCHVADEGALLAWDGSAWQPALSAIAGLSAIQNLALLGIGTTADAANPMSAKLNNTLWAAKTVAEGGNGDLRYKLSKESAAKTLSFLFQDNFSGRAEIGLTGDDNFHFKVSPDGATWSDALVIDKTTGKVTLRGFTDATASRAQLYAAPVDALAFNGMQLNGAMEVSQENGTSAVTCTATGSLQTKYLLDGVMAAYRGSFVATAQQVASPFVGSRYALKVTVGTAQASLGANDELTIFIPFEGVRVSRLALGAASAAAQSLGFWFQAHRTGTYSGSIRNASKARSYPFTFTVAAADTPVWVSMSGALAIPGDTAGTWAADNTVGMSVSICLAGGSSRVGTAAAWAGADYSGATGTTNGVGATSDVFYVGNLISVPGIELPASDRAAFVMRPSDQELSLAQRYLELGGGGITGTWDTAAEVSLGWRYRVSKRAVAAITLLTTTPVITEVGVADRTGTGSSLVLGDGNVDGTRAIINGFTGSTIHHGAIVTASGGNILMANARL